MVEKFNKKNLSPSSKLWLTRQHRDNFSRQAKIANYRSRAAYKLLQILERDNLLHPNQILADLGAAPGGWAQVAANIIGDKGHVFAIDLLPVTGINRVTIMEGNFLDYKMVEEMQEKIINLYKKVNESVGNIKENAKLDGVLSDLSPNISGIRISDNMRALELWQSALRFCLTNLKKRPEVNLEDNVSTKKVNLKKSQTGGYFICKLFQSEEAREFTQECRKYFDRVHIRKPEASRSDSRECYLVAIDFK